MLIKGQNFYNPICYVKLDINFEKTIWPYIDDEGLVLKRT
jgi:hypothetical protein